MLICYYYNYTFLFCVLMPCAMSCGTFIKHMIPAKQKTTLLLYTTALTSLHHEISVIQYMICFYQILSPKKIVMFLYLLMQYYSKLLNGTPWYSGSTFHNIRDSLAPATWGTYFLLLPHYEIILYVQTE